jgi:adenylosuccinate lyase
MTNSEYQASLDHTGYQSPFSWRYGSEAMRALWSERHKRVLWRQLWAALARAQAEAGLVTHAQADELAAHVEHVDFARAAAIEAEIHHDLMAEVRAFAEQCPIGGGIIHLGATSADIEDNADALRLRGALGLLEARLNPLLRRFAVLIEAQADQVCMAYTHLQPAEPTTVGYRLALYAQDLLEDWQALCAARDGVRGKGFKGAVGTRASYAELLAGTGVSPAQLEAAVLAPFGLAAFPVTGQTYPRRQDYAIVSMLAGLAGTLYRFAFDLRLLQSPLAGEWREPFGRHQVGSSAMPFKRNPINSEKLDSLGRLVESLVSTAWGNMAHSLLERTLDDSANRRELLPTVFLAVEEMLITAERLVGGLVFDADAMARNVARFGTFAATERLLMAVVRAGADRQSAHEHLREHSLAAWEAVRAGLPNPLSERLTAEPFFLNHLSAEAIRLSLDASAYVGDAPDRARACAGRITALLDGHAHGAASA